MLQHFDFGGRKCEIKKSDLINKVDKVEDDQIWVGEATNNSKGMDKEDTVDMVATITMVVDMVDMDLTVVDMVMAVDTDMADMALQLLDMVEVVRDTAHTKSFEFEEL